MRYPGLSPAAMLTGAFAFGCGDQQSPTAPADQPAPSLRATVERSTVPFGFAFTDGNRWFSIGATFDEVISFFCTGSDIEVDQVDQLAITRPDGSIKLQLKGKHVNLVLLDTPILSCETFLNAPHYTGTGRFSNNDNDFFVTGNRADASTLHAVGTVTGEDGQRYHVVAFGNQVLAPKHPAPDIVVQHQRTKIQLTPIGQ